MIDWTTPLSVLSTSVAGSPAGTLQSAGLALEASLGAAGTSHDRAARALPPPTPASSAASTGYNATFAAARKVVRWTGGTAPTFDTTAPTNTALATALATAVTAISGNPAKYGTTALTQSRALQSELASQFLALPTPPTVGDEAALTALINDASAFAALLRTP